jgi:hypothetical protein
MDEVVRWLRVVAVLLAILVVQVGWVGMQVLMRPAVAQGPIDVRIHSQRSPVEVTGTPRQAWPVQVTVVR